MDARKTGMLARIGVEPAVLRRLALPVASLVLSACAQYPKTQVSSTRSHGAIESTSYWEGDNTQGTPSITIKLHEQKAYFYKGDVLVGVSLLSTGREGHGTQPGEYTITQLDEDHASNLYGHYADAGGRVVRKNVSVRTDRLPKGAHFVGAPMPYYMRIYPSTGLHGGFLPGYPASHGCVRMPHVMAEAFFRSVAIGTRVTVEG